MKRAILGLLAVAVVAGSAQAALFTYTSASRSVFADNLVYSGVEGYPDQTSSDRSGAFMAGASASWQNDRAYAWQNSIFGGHYIIASGYAECELIGGSPGGSAQSWLSTAFVLDEAMPNSEIIASIAALTGATPAPSAYVRITGPGLSYDSSVDGSTFSWSGTLQPGSYSVTASVYVDRPYTGKVGSEFDVTIIPTPGTLGLGALAMLAMLRARPRHVTS